MKRKSYRTTFDALRPGNIISCRIGGEERRFVKVHLRSRLTGFLYGRSWSKFRQTYVNISTHRSLVTDIWRHPSLRNLPDEQTMFKLESHANHTK